MSRIELLERLNSIDELIKGMEVRHNSTIESAISVRYDFIGLYTKYCSRAQIQKKSILRLEKSFNLSVINYLKSNI